MLPYIPFSPKRVVQSGSTFCTSPSNLASISLLLLKTGISFPGQVVVAAKVTLFLLKQELTDIYD